MSDLIDDANDRAERDLQLSIERQRRATAATVLTPSDECANDCGTAPRERSPFCSRECRDDHAAREAQLKRNGK